MKRLFIRFYIGVLLILFFAWSIQAYVFQPRSEAANVEVVEEALGGGVRLARERLADCPPAQRSAVLAELQRKFDYPLRLISWNQVPDYARDRFSQGADVVLIGWGTSTFVVAPLPDQQALQFGAFPAFAGPSQTELMAGLGLVLLLAASAIALLLRPVARQLRLVERAAAAFARGDFSARVDERRVNSARTLAGAFNHMADRTGTMLRTQRELLQAVSHELRTPLSRIHFAIDLIRDAENKAQRDQRLESLETASHELDALVGELLSYVRLETGVQPEESSNVALHPLVAQLFERQSPHRPDIVFEIGESLAGSEISLSADEVGLERALGNLIRNAGRFAAHRVIVNATETAGEVVIDVDDDGPGIPQSDRQRVFEVFVRLDDSGRGVGLGLALVRRIVANHGGTVTAEESPLGGCRMRMRWPADAISGPRPPPVAIHDVTRR